MAEEENRPGRSTLTPSSPAAASTSSSTITREDDSNTWGGISGGFLDKSSSELVLPLGCSFVGYLKRFFFFNTVKNDHENKEPNCDDS